MLKGDKGSSNTDPHATGPDPDNEWVVTAPHVMVLFEDAKCWTASQPTPQPGAHM